MGIHVCMTPLSLHLHLAPTVGEQGVLCWGWADRYSMHPEEGGGEQEKGDHAYTL